MLSLTKLRERVYALKFDSSYEMCMTFLRYEEFYECSNPAFQGKAFTLAEYMAWYAQTFGEGQFTYPEDWGGFNFPLNVIKKVQQVGIPDANHYDDFMAGVYGLINTTDPDSYLIGFSDEEGYKDHELTHAMYYIDDEYRTQANFIIASAGEAFVVELKQALQDEGYASSIVLDEIQAYITTGEMEMFDDVEDKERLDVLRTKLKELHKKHFVAFMQHKDNAGNVGSNPTEDARVERGDA